MVFTKDVVRRLSPAPLPPSGLFSSRLEGGVGGVPVVSSPHLLSTPWSAATQTINPGAWTLDKHLSSLYSLHNTDTLKPATRHRYILGEFFSQVLGNILPIFEKGSRKFRISYGDLGGHFAFLVNIFH